MKDVVGQAIVDLANNQNQKGANYNALVLMRLIYAAKNPLHKTLRTTIGKYNDGIVEYSYPLGHPKVPRDVLDVVMQRYIHIIKNQSVWGQFGKQINQEQLIALLRIGLTTVYDGHQRLDADGEVNTILWAGATTELN